MSFLIDPPLLFVSGLSLGRFVPKGSLRRRLALGILGVFYVVSGLLYLDKLPWWDGRRWTRGSAFMLNSGLNTRLKRRAGHDVLAVVLFAAYPLWLWFGMELGQQARGDDEAGETGETEETEESEDAEETGETGETEPTDETPT
jgi:hypothetical protein